MTEMLDDEKFWKLRFRVEVSARYHDWRRGTLTTYASLVRFVSLFGSLLAFAAVSSWVESDQVRVTAVVVATLFVAGFNAIDLVFGTEARVRAHTDLYRRFKSLQEEIARQQSDWPNHIQDWTGEAEEIDRDEPPTMWAIYVLCWNQTVEKHGADKKYMRQIGWVRTLIGRFLQFRPKDFPFAA